MPHARSLILAVLACAFGATIASAADKPRVLFIRGGDRTGGFLEAKTDEQRTEQLADIGNRSTDRGNHGWWELAQRLREKGYDLEQVTEGPAEKPGPVDLQKIELAKYAVVVFASNNAIYSKQQADLVWKYVHEGGGALFISDCNFGPNWGAAPTSDQSLLDRTGIIVNQDHGRYALKRSEGDFIADEHPILNGVGAFDGEGVSPGQVPAKSPEGFTITRVVAARDRTRDNDKPEGGTFRPVHDRDAALIAIEHGKGRAVLHFDRNTFFNKNGAGTDIHRHDNRRYAENLFAWLSGR